MKTETNLRSESRTGRLLGIAGLAGLITGGLFLAMNTLVRVDEVALGEREFRTLSNVRLPEEVFIEPESGRNPPTRIETAKPPERKDIPKMDPGGIVISADYVPEPEVRVPRAAINTVNYTPVSFGPEIATAIRAPVPVYPRRALDAGLEGECDVNFAIDPAGRPYNLEAKCTDEVFARSSVQAVRKAMFAAKIVDGVAQGQDNLVYPIVFTLSSN